MFEEIWNAYTSEVGSAWPRMALAASLAGTLAALSFRAADLRERAAPILGLLPRMLLGAALLVGTALAIARASVFDDAFISFRFVSNLLDGNGLIWNEGERVEGYTNFLWVMIVAAFSKVSTLQPAEAGLWASLAVFPCSLLIAFKLEQMLALTANPDGEPRARFVPIATLLLALQDTFLSAGSTGLETGFAALLVSVGVLQMMRAETPRDWGFTGGWFILATLTRPDHAIFYATASACLAFEQVALLVRQGKAAIPEASRRVLAFAAAFVPYAAHSVWRHAFYGEWLPNTYYVKAADGSNFAQGAAYAATFYLGSHLWLLLPVVFWYALRRASSTREQRFKRFLVLALVVYNFYVLKVGGDFMYGRFFVSLLPLMLIALSRAAQQALPQKRWAGVALVASLGATVGGVTMIGPGKIRWGICDERTMYELEAWHPIAIDHSNFRVSQILRKWHDAGLHLRVATSGIGMIGYYSRMEVIDLMGLTDKHVARQPLTRRGRPGHEKHAEPAYIEQRMPHVVRGNYSPRRHDDVTRLHFPRSVVRRKWFIYHYDEEVMARIRELSPEVGFKRFETYLTDYISNQLPKRTLDELDEDDRFFQRFYFKHNNRQDLQQAWNRALAAARSR